MTIVMIGNIDHLRLGRMFMQLPIESLNGRKSLNAPSTRWMKMEITTGAMIQI